MRTCSKCKVEKPEGDFYANKKCWCKQCYRDAGKAYRQTPEGKAKKQELGRRYYQRNTEKILANSKKRRREDHIKSKFGMTLDDVRELQKQQENKCAICLNDFVSTPCIDHCHATGKVRGLLCTNCNHGLGKFKDDQGCLQRAIEYLRKGQ